jgi:hypothetical protein
MEDEMHLHPTMTSQIAARHIAELHQQAARQRLVCEVRAAKAAIARNDRMQVGRTRLSLRRPRPAAA